MPACSTCDSLSIGPYVFHPLPPPVDVLRSGASLSRSEVDQTRRTVNAIISDISRIESEKARALAILSHLSDEQKRLETSLREHQSLLAPIRGLPSEILTYIFLQHEPPSHSPLNSFHPQGVLLLGQICSRWREVVHSTPQLWSSIRMKFTSDLPNSRTAAILLQYWLLRAGVHPLSLTIHCLTCARDDCDLYMPILDLLNDSRHLWRDVQLCLPFRLYERLNPLAERLPLLETLDVGIPDFEYDSKFGIKTFADAPKLTAVTFGSRTTSTTFQLPVAQLTSCAMNDLVFREVRSFMAACPNLVDCTAPCYTGWWDEPPFAWPVIHISRPLMRTLKLNVRDENAYVVLLDCLQAEALTSLHVTFVERGLKWSQRTFTSFLSRSACNLRELALCGVIFAHANALVECLNELTTLIELKLQFISSTEGDVLENTLGNMTIGSGGHKTELVPHLTRFTCVGMSFVNDAAIVAMIESRRRSYANESVDMSGSSASQLGSVHLEIPHGFKSPETLVDFQRWKAEGLKVDIWFNIPSSKNLFGACDKLRVL